MIKKGLYLIAFTIAFLLFSISSGFTQQQTTEKKSFIKDVTPKEAYELINKYYKDGQLIIVDVRTETEFESGHIKGAVNINLFSDNFKEKLKKLNKEKKYLVYCRSGSRSRVATSFMEDLGFKKIYNLDGGILNWEEAGYPIVEEN